MNKNKIKILYDAQILISGLKKNSSRSGIYFVGVNVLKYLVQRNDVEVKLYCKSDHISSIKELVKKEFPNYNFEYIEKYPYTVEHIYKKIKNLKKYAKNHNAPYIKFVLQVFLWFIAPFKNIRNKDFFSKIAKECNDCDVFFSPVFEICSVVKTMDKIDKYILLHDTITLNDQIDSINTIEKFNPDNWFIKLINSINNKDYYFTNSENTKRDFLRVLPDKINPEHIYTTLLACNESFKPQKDNIEQIKAKYNIPQDKKYIFSLCTLEPRKNLIRAVKTFIQFIQKNNIDNMVFVLGGGYWEMFIDKFETELSALGTYRDYIVKAGYVDDEDLPALYSNAQWFVYTSQYEGFGLPPLEAMSCGCPVITSNNSSLPEVVGDAGIMIDWDSDEQHIQAYEKYYYNDELRKENAQKGLERAKLFSWEKCVNEMVDIMKRNAGKV